MHLTLPLLALTALTPTTLAWRFRAYRDKNYGTIIADYDGSRDALNVCHRMAVDNAASSFKWDPCAGGGSDAVHIYLYDSRDCSGTPFGDSNPTWHKSSMPSNDKLSSFKVGFDNRNC
ncbi:hypothetical protein HK104_002944 [Borealophlyctis nickersoniae]|nr:hypothetical protein HK104_002944 [Borealophlyctis nickersoniae]